MLAKTIRTAAALGALIIATGAAAQTISLDRPHRSNGSIEASDRANAENQRYDDRTIRLSAGQRVRFTAESEAIDPIVQVFRPGATAEPLAENDDSGETLNSLLIFTAPAAGDYVVRVSNFDEDTTGAYVFAAETLPPLQPPMTRPSGTETSTWQVYRGTLAESDPVFGTGPSDDYQVRVGAGEALIIRADAADFDVMVQVLPAAAREGDPLDGDDDSGPGTNSLLGFEPEEAGDYVVRVTGFSPESRGAYTLRIGR